MSSVVKIIACGILLLLVISGFSEWYVEDNYICKPKKFSMLKDYYVKTFKSTLELKYPNSKIEVYNYPTLCILEATIEGDIVKPQLLRIKVNSQKVFNAFIYKITKGKESFFSPLSSPVYKVTLFMYEIRALTNTIVIIGLWFIIALYKEKE